MRLDDLNALGRESAARALAGCCGSARWARLMAEARPFASAEAMAVTSDAIWASLEREDWLEAFAAHPKIGDTRSEIGDTRSGGAGRPSEPGWSQQEQAGMAGAAETTRRRLAEANRDYDARFGYIFIVCATGKTADQMLEIVERRLRNGPDEELRAAAEEQRKITRLRLGKLVETDQVTTR